jgi:carbon-monoxide dehydrogenase large subunit
VNAVVDALRPFGVSDVRMPCTPERIWKAIHTGGGTEPTEKGAMPHFDENDVADRTDGASA